MEVCPFVAFLHMINLTTIFNTLNISDVTTVPQQILDRFLSVHIGVTTCIEWYSEDGLTSFGYIPRIVFDCGSSEKRLQTNACI